MRYTFLKADLEMPLKAVMRSLYEQEVIRKLHLWPLNEPYLVWVDIGETHDDGVILSEKPFSLPLEYHVRFFLCNVWYDHIQIGHVHLILGDALRLLGFLTAFYSGPHRIH
jgi:hypothetical protein